MGHFRKIYLSALFSVLFTLFFTNLALPPCAGAAARAEAVNKIAAGGAHTVTIKSDGTLWAWGFNGMGQFGDGNTRDGGVSTQANADTHWTSIAAGYYHTVAIKSDGTLWAWVDSEFGQLGNGSGDYLSNTIPVKITSAGNEWFSVAAGYGHTVAIRSDGTLWAWGLNNR